MSDCGFDRSRYVSQRILNSIHTTWQSGGFAALAGAPDLHETEWVNAGAQNRKLGL